MNAEQMAEAITAQVLFLIIVGVAIYIAVRCLRNAVDFQSPRQAGFFIVGLFIALLRGLQDIWHHGLLSAALDPFLWLLALPVYVLYRKLQSTAAASQRAQRVQMEHQFDGVRTGTVGPLPANQEREEDRVSSSTYE